MPNTLNEWAYECHKSSLEAGWWAGYIGNDPAYLAMKIALIHSEISEALEGIRKNNMDSHLPHRKAVEVELADALHRIFDLAGAEGYDLDGALMEKRRYNKSRADHKIEARQAADGKKI